MACNLRGAARKSRAARIDFFRCYPQRRANGGFPMEAVNNLCINGEVGGQGSV
jgi:hypothetical protein